ncbi:LuxR C-terminal-related transcriptional regulator [Actinomadura sp. ATCC 31491]|uniref:LuxR C-terminal-related transcriptional regulator n=1 Tax=Actinomadura luzonensis TaxID=2805427 RepID=A0ABT0FK46_9ACTN|nr:LuxR C-terminal-related transcriptional regulator [Actinomadura luzonensis]MCK2212678.1 LuxR C-terminal-related transcriptional regulator [Actinomadura luzonensis]
MTAHVPHNLPAEPNRFVGRARDVAELAALVRDERVVTLSGVGGIGKTRLALRVAARVVPCFADGVWLAELARIGDPELLVPELAGVLGVRDETPGPLLDGLLLRLRAARTLLVLDNCEHVVERCAEVVSELVAACPRVRFLVTSREPLHVPGELVWRVPPLDLPDERHPDAESVVLFAERATAAGARGVIRDLDGVVRLCRALDGLPLALELAAARASLLSPGRIADRIADRFRLLTTGDRTAPPRQRTLLATVEWSHDLLRPKERVLLRRLSVFAGLFDLGLAERVCADGGVLRRAELLDLMGGLVDKSLVLHQGAAGRYRLLETIRQYAADRLAEAGEEAALRERHLRVVCEEMERRHEAAASRRRLPWGERFPHFVRGRELLDDCRAAIDWAVESGDPVPGLRLARAALAILAVRGDLRESVGWHERLLAMDLSEVPDDLVAVGRAALAYGLEAGDELGRAEELVARAVEEQKRHPYSYWLGVTYGVAITVFFRLGQSERALRYLEELEAAAVACDDPFNLATVRVAQLNLALFKGQVRYARRRGEEALALARECGHHWAEARALTHLGAVAEADGDLEGALTCHEAALPLLRGMDNLVELARCHAQLGRVAAELGDHRAARRHVAAGLALSRRAGQRRGIMRGLMALSALARAQGDLEGALLAAAAGTALRESIGQFGTPGRVRELLEEGRARLGEGRVTLLWSRGTELPAEEVTRRVLDHESAPPPVAPVRVESRYGGLTGREQEVAALLARGLSNRGIALELVISPATVARHVANVMEKLGFASRAQIAVWAVEHGLAPGPEEEGSGKGLGAGSEGRGGDGELVRDPVSGPNAVRLGWGARLGPGRAGEGDTGHRVDVERA